MDAARVYYGKRVGNIRRALGLSLEKWGRLWGLSRQAAHKIERGRVPFPLERLRCLEDCGINAGAYIVSGSGNMFSRPYDDVLAAVQDAIEQQPTGSEG